MAMQTFAAIHVGSNDTSMKIYQIMPRKGFHLLDTANIHVELGADTYNTGRLSNASIEGLCDILLKFRSKMKEYGVTEYKAYATSAVREATNCEMALDRIFTRTGIEVKPATNSEHRFMMYEGIAATLENFSKIIAKNTAVLDVGAGSIQISIFDKQKMTVTQNIPIGALRIRENLATVDASVGHMKEVMEEYIENELTTFEGMYLKDKEIKNIIGVGEEIAELADLIPEMHIKDTLNEKQLDEICKRLENKTPQRISEEYGVAYDRATLLMPAALLHKMLLVKAKAEVIYIARATFCDGMVAEYMESEKKLKLGHDFQSDIVSSAKSISKRYRCNKLHCQAVADSALRIYDSMKGLHGLDRRARLQLELASILHDCGKFVNLNNVADNSFHIIMSTEILGISHQERLEIACICKYNTIPYPSYAALEEDLTKEQYSKVAKLVAILKVANAMDRSHKQKITKFSVTIKNKQLVIMADTVHDIALESGLFESKANFFEDAYGIRPVLRQKRSV